MRSLRIALLLCVLFVPAGRADDKAIGAVLAKALADFEAPGLACVIVKDDKVVYLAGHGVRDLNSKEPVTPNTLFAIASCSKAFTATAVGFLVADKKMSWDDPVRKHLPTFRMSDELADRDVTIRDLLCHRTGVIRHDILWQVHPWSRDEFIRRHGLLKPDKQFRSVYGYNNFQFLAAGEAAGKAAGTSWESLVRSKIFTPLGMKSANFSTTDLEKAADRARPHYQKDGGKPGPIEFRNIDNIAPAGAINASVSELSAWIRFQLGEGEFEGKQLLPASILKETHTPQVVIVPTPELRKLAEGVTTQSSYGLGWRIYDYRGQRVVEHGGSIDGFRSQVTLLPDKKIGIAILTNLARTQLPVAATNSVLEVLLDAPKTDWNARFIESEKERKAKVKKTESDLLAKRKQNTKPSLDLAGYEGNYDEPAHGRVRIGMKEGTLEFHWGRHDIRLEHFHFDTFRMKESPGLFPEMWGNRQIVFRLDGAGEAESFTYLGQEFKRVRTSKK